MAGIRVTAVGMPARPVRELGGFFAMALDTLVAIPAQPFAWREFVIQAWFVARVSLLPTVLLSIPFSVLLVFTFNILFAEFGAADFSGTGAAKGTVTQIGPIVTVLVVAGAGATAMCADLGARTIREELDALRDGHQSDSGAGRAARPGRHPGRSRALIGGHHRRVARKLLLRGLRPERHSRSVCRRADIDHRSA